MSWQLFLTVWLIIQMIASTANQSKLNKLKVGNEYNLVGSIVGNILKYIGIFACLYFGGFYN